MSDFSGSPLSPGPWVVALSVLCTVSALSCAGVGALGLTCTGLGGGSGSGPSLAGAQPCAEPGV